MLGLEIVLVAVGIFFIIISFRITESLTQKELEHLGHLSGDELKKIVDNELKSATIDIDHRIDDVIDESMEKVEIAMDKETNSKIMAISEFSDGVIDKINQNHEEVMFLYSMLNDKHAQLTEFAGQIEQMTGELYSRAEEKRIEEKRVEEIRVKEPTPEPVIPSETVVNHHGTRPFTNFDSFDESEAILNTSKITKREAIDISESEEEVAPPPATVPKAMPVPDQTAVNKTLNHNGEILRLFEEGKDIMQIAKELKLGMGEVKLVVDLYKGAH